MLLEFAIKKVLLVIALAEAKQLTGKGSLITAELRYRDQLQRFKAQCAHAGIHRVHGLRHQYANAL